MKPSMIGKAVLALALIASVAGAAAVPARADDRDHDRREWREHEHYRHRERRVYVPPPAYVEAPPPVIYAPPPPASLGLNLIFPLQFR